MDAYTLSHARQDWAHCTPRSDEPLCADALIALAVNCKRQTHQPSAPLTPEDAAILLRQAPAGRRIDEGGNYIAFGPCQGRALRFVLSLNR